MTIEQTEAPEALPPELEITFKGRLIWVRMPTPEQLLVWKRTLRQLQDAEVKSWNAEQVMIALERTRKIIDSVLVNKADVIWLDDEMLEGNLTLLDTAQIIQSTVEKFADEAKAEGNRETRRAKAAPKKARRKAPAK